jgi:hypothetical protein
LQVMKYVSDIGEHLKNHTNGYHIKAGNDQKF